MTFEPITYENFVFLAFRACRIFLDSCPMRPIRNEENVKKKRGTVHLAKKMLSQNIMLFRVDDPGCTSEIPLASINTAYRMKLAGVADTG